jgi:hypothetical protein
MTFLAMPDSAETVVPRSWRTRFWLLRADKWLVPAERCFTFPEAVKRNRFLVPLWVFCLGMAVFSKFRESPIVLPEDGGEKGEIRWVYKAGGSEAIDESPEKTVNLPPPQAMTLKFGPPKFQASYPDESGKTSIP